MGSEPRPNPKPRRGKKKSVLNFVWWVDGRKFGGPWSKKAKDNWSKPKKPRLRRGSRSER